MKLFLHTSCSIAFIFLHHFVWAQSDVTRQERARYLEVKKNQRKEIVQSTKKSSPFANTSTSSFINEPQQDSNNLADQPLKKTPKHLTVEAQKKYWIEQLEQNRLLDDKARLRIKMELAKLSNQSTEQIHQAFPSEKITYSSRELIEKWKKQNPALQQEIILWNQKFPNQPIRWQDIKSISTMEKKLLLEKIQEEKELDNRVK